MHKTIFDSNFKITDSDSDFEYQKYLTEKLDSDKSDFNQNKLNEIVLWKVNRFAKFNEETIDLINSISPSESKFDPKKTKTILKLLLKTKGVQLAMASTILRYRNPKIYQIIDQRVYRIIHKDKELKLSVSPSDKNIDKSIELYLTYLKDLREACEKLKIEFKKSDRILFMADRRINKQHKLNNY
ncbi:MAG: hypothetical protein WC148_04640 [Bacilli bacterium]